jgi:hypothetical protein
MEDDLITRLRKRAAIRRQIQTRKSVQEGAPDRIADLLEEAAAQLTKAEAENKKLVEALRTVFKIANPGASSNEWLCFKAAKEALMINLCQEDIFERIEKANTEELHHVKMEKDKS